MLRPLKNVLLDALSQLRSGRHGIAFIHGLRCRARHLLCGVRALMRGCHKIQLVPQLECALLQADERVCLARGMVTARQSLQHEARQC